MGIKSGLNSVNRIYVGNVPVSEVYHGVNLVFSLDRGDLSLWRYSNSEIAGKTLLYEYLGSYNNLPNNTLYVPKVNGKAIINYYLPVSKVEIPFYENLNVKNVDLQGVKFRNNSMFRAFLNCQNLLKVKNISESVSNLDYTFRSCYNFNQNIQICNGITSLYGTFYSCIGLNQNIQIPNSVIDIRACFGGCSKLNQNIQIPNSVNYMVSTFDGCSQLNCNIRIPSSVSLMDTAFGFCRSLNQNIQIPRGVMNMVETFHGCTILNCNINIPNSVTNMYACFLNCLKFEAWVNVHSEKITNYDISLAFNTRNTISPKIPNVIFPARYINNKATLTQLALKNAGWKVSGIGAVEGNSPEQIRSWDVIKGNYNNFKGNGTYWELHKWNGALATALNNGVTVTDVVVPEYFTTYDTFPSALNYPCFRRNNSLTSVDFGCEIPWVANKMGNQTNNKNDATRVGAFDGCNNMLYIKGVVHLSVTQMVDAFSDSTNLTHTDVVIPEGVTNCVGLYYNSYNIEVPAPFPSTVTSLGGAFSSSFNTITGRLSGSVVIPKSVTSAVSLFRNRQENIGNVYVLSPTISNIDNIWGKYPTTFKKPFYIYYKYSNNVNTATYELFKKKAVFYGTSGNGAGVNPMYNSTSNFYVYDLSSIYNNLWNHTIYLTPAQKLVKLIKYKGNDKHVALMTNYPDLKPHIFEVNCFNNCRYIKTLALYDANIDALAGSCTNMFRNCYNLRVVQGLRLDKVVGSTVGDTNVNLPYSFENCYNLRVMSSIPSNVKSMYYTFRNCYNFDFNVQIKEGVRNMVGAFSGCTNLNKNIKIPNTVINISDIFYGCYNLNQNIQIPANVTNMKNAFYSCCNLYGRIDILSNAVIDSSNCFMGCSKFKEVHIPYKYTNEVNSKTFNSFVSAGYLYSNGASTGKNNTRFYNIVL